MKRKKGHRADALASRADEGRGIAAISLGQLRASVAGDFRMGQPCWFHHQQPYTEHIGVAEATGGTETSNYPEEQRLFP